MGYRLGIDLGATTAVAVVADDTGAVRALQLGHQAHVAAAVLVDTNGSVRCGDDAIAGASAAPDRLVRRFVQRIGDEVPITVGPAGGTHLRLNPQDLTAAMVAWVVARATAAERSVPEMVALVHPAGWAAHKSELMQRALAARGLGAVRLVNAAAAVGHIWVRGVGAASGDAFAIFDLGGESVGATVLRVDPEGRAWPLGVPAVRQDLGGVDFDDAVLRQVLDSLDPAVRQALSQDTSNAGTPALDALRQACRKAKETLSAATDATVEVHVAGRRIPTRITRAEFEGEVAEVARRGVDLLLDAVAEAGLRPGDLSGVMLCGGTSAVPLIAQQLSSRLGPAARLVREPHPAFTAAAGAALLCGPVALAAIEEKAPAPPAPERPQLEVPTVVGRKPTTIPAARVEQPDPAARWGSIRIAPMRKAGDSAPQPERPEAKAEAKAAAEREKALARQAAAERERVAAQLAAERERAAAQRRQAAAQQAAEREAAARQAAEREAVARQAAERAQAATREAAARQAAECEQARREAVAREAEPAAETRPTPAVLPELRRPTRTDRRGGRQPVVPAPRVTVRSVVGPRELGSLADLLGTAAPERIIPRSGSADDAQIEFPAAPAADLDRAADDLDPGLAAELEDREDGEYWEYADAEEYGEDDDYAAVPQQLWRRGLGVCRPRRVLAVAAIAMALFIGADGWQEATAPIVSGSTSASDGQSATTGATSAATHSAQATTRVDHTDSIRRASVLPR